MRLLSVLLFACCFFCLPSCRQNDSVARAAIGKMLNRFPELRSSELDWSLEYHLVRKMSFGDPLVSIALYVQLEPEEESQEFLVFTKGEWQAYAVPLLSNTHRDYWQFPGEFLPKGVKPLTATFEGELNRCLNVLELNDTLNTAKTVLNQLFFSVLICRQVELGDSANLSGLYWTKIDSLPEENWDTCAKRNLENWLLISRDLPRRILKPSFISYWDRKRARTYQLLLENYESQQKNFFPIAVYRQDCNHYRMKCGNSLMPL